MITKPNSFRFLMIQTGVGKNGDVIVYSSDRVEQKYISGYELRN